MYAITRNPSPVFSAEFLSKCDSDGSLALNLETPDLLIRSIKESDWESYKHLYKEECLPEKEDEYQQQVRERFQNWVACWKSGNPISALAVFEKRSKEFVGNILMHVSRDMVTPGIPELRVKMCPNKEDFTDVVVKVFLNTIFRGLQGEYEVGGSPLGQIQAANSRNEAVNAAFRKHMIVIDGDSKHPSYKF